MWVRENECFRRDRLVPNQVDMCIGVVTIIRGRSPCDQWLVVGWWSLSVEEEYFVVIPIERKYDAI